MDCSMALNTEIKFFYQNKNINIIIIILVIYTKY